MKPMDPIFLKYYRNARANGANTVHAARYGKTMQRWHDLQAQGLVKVEFEPECEPFDDSYLETWDLTPRQLAHEKKELYKFLDREGVWCVVGYYRTSTADSWHVGASLGQFVGFDLESGTIEIAGDTIDAFETENARAADAYAARPTFAMVAP